MIYVYEINVAGSRSPASKQKSRSTVHGPAAREQKRITMDTIH